MSAPRTPPLADLTPVTQGTIPELPAPIPAVLGWMGGGGRTIAEQHPNLCPADRARGTLKLTNLSLDMSGLYECEAENRAGSAKCSIILEVHSSECGCTGRAVGRARGGDLPHLSVLTASEGAIIAGAVLGSVGALATVAFFTQRVLGYRRKKRDGQEEAANEIK